MKKLIIFSYPYNVYWFSTVFPLLWLSMRYFSSVLSKGIASQLIPSIAHLYQEKTNRYFSLIFSIIGFISIFFSTLSIRSFSLKIPFEKQKGNFKLYSTLITVFGFLFGFSFFLLNLLDINRSPILTSLNLSIFFLSSSIFHFYVGKIPARVSYIDDISSVFNYVIIIFSAVSIITFNISCVTHRIDNVYYISSISQYVAFIFSFLKYILIGTHLNGEKFLSFFVEGKPRNNIYAQSSNNAEYMV